MAMPGAVYPWGPPWWTVQLVLPAVGFPDGDTGGIHNTSMSGWSRTTTSAQIPPSWKGKCQINTYFGCSVSSCITEVPKTQALWQVIQERLESTCTHISVLSWALCCLKDSGMRCYPALWRTGLLSLHPTKHWTPAGCKCKQSKWLLEGTSTFI